MVRRRFSHHQGRAVIVSTDVCRCGHRTHRLSVRQVDLTYFVINL